MTDAQIVRFRGPHRFLSNFHPSPVRFEDNTYPTVEHAYQAAKTLDASARESIRLCHTPGEAKRLGQRVSIRPEWEEVKVGIMDAMLRQKFADPELWTKLAATRPAVLIEGNDWGDEFWGCTLHDDRWVGHNWLGRLLMSIRDFQQP